jgi:hypothetical protein
VKLHLPYLSEKSRITVRNEVVEVKAFQIIVWVSISSQVSSQWDPGLPKLPAILDIGSTHNFAMTELHLLEWSGIHAVSLPALGRIRREGRKAPLRRAGLWLHTNGESFELTIDEGIAVFDGDWPRLPILGLRALTNSQLHTFIYGDTKQVLIRTPRKWYWPF